MMYSVTERLEIKYLLENLTLSIDLIKLLPSFYQSRLKFRNCKLKKNYIYINTYDYMKMKELNLVIMISFFKLQFKKRYHDN